MSSGLSSRRRKVRDGPPPRFTERLSHPEGVGLPKGMRAGYLRCMTHFHTTRRVEFCDTDLAGIVHFANFYRYMEQAEHAFFRTLGLKIHGHLPDGIEYGWPRVAASCSFHAPAYYEQIVEIRITITRRSPRSLTAKYDFFHGNVPLANGEMKTAFCVFPPGEKMQSANLPDEIAAILDAAATRAEALLDPDGHWSA